MMVVVILTSVASIRTMYVAAQSNGIVPRTTRVLTVYDTSMMVTKFRHSHDLMFDNVCRPITNKTLYVMHACMYVSSSLDLRM